MGGNKGLGFLLVDAEGQGNTAGVFVAIVMLTLIGVLAYGAVVWAEKRVLHYLPKANLGTVNAMSQNSLSTVAACSSPAAPAASATPSPKRRHAPALGW